MMNRYADARGRDVLKELQAEDREIRKAVGDRMGLEDASLMDKIVKGAGGALHPMLEGMALGAAATYAGGPWAGRVATGGYWQQQGAGQFKRSFYFDKDVDSLSDEQIRNVDMAAQALGVPYALIEFAVSSVPGMKALGSSADKQIANAVVNRLMRNPTLLKKLSREGLAYGVRFVMESLFEESGQGMVESGAKQVLDKVEKGDFKALLDLDWNKIASEGWEQGKASMPAVAGITTLGSVAGARSSWNEGYGKRSEGGGQLALFGEGEGFALRGEQQLDNMGLSKLRKVAEREGVSLDGVVNSAPSVREAIRGKRAEVMGQESGGGGQESGRDIRFSDTPAAGRSSVQLALEMRRQSAPFLYRNTESKAGRRLVRRFVNDSDGRNVGVRSIVAFVNEALGVEMRRSRAFGNRSAHFHSRSLTLSPYPSSQVNFHEVGHRVEVLLRRAGALSSALQAAALDFRQSPLSVFASGKPDGPMAMSEGLAEWVRNFIFNPDAVRNHRLSALMDEAMNRRGLEPVGAVLRDAARAFRAHAARDVDAIFESESSDDTQVEHEVLTGNALVGAMIRNEHGATATVRDLKRAVKKVLKVRKRVNEVFDWLKPLESKVLSAHASMARVATEVDRIAFGTKSGQKHGLNGISVIDASGKRVYFTNRSVNDILEMVPHEHRRDAWRAVQAKAALEKYRKKGIEYSGINNGVTPDMLAEIVAGAEATIPNFDAFAAAQQEFFDAALDVAVFTGRFDAAERSMIVGAYDFYTYLEPKYRPVAGRTKAGEADAGIHRAFGNQDGIKELSEAMVDRLRSVLTFYYENEAKKSIRTMSEAVLKNKDLPPDLREYAGRVLVPIPAKVEYRGAADMNAIREAVAKYMNDTFGMEVAPNDVNIEDSLAKVFRRGRPNELNVITIWDGGKPSYYMVNDPAVFNMYVHQVGDDVVNNVLRLAAREVSAITKNIQRVIVSAHAFGVVNVGVRDAARAVWRGEGWRMGIWYYPLVRAALNRALVKLPGKFGRPEIEEHYAVLQEAMRQHDSGTAQALGRNSFVRMFMEGWSGSIGSNVKNPALKFMANAAHPANWVNTVLKPLDVLFYVTGGRQFNTLMESLTREGAMLDALDRGATLEEALMVGEDITGRFGSRGGNKTVSDALRIGMFVNPNLQIMYDSIMMVTDPDSRVGRRHAARSLLIAGYAAGLAAFVASLMSDDDEEWYKEATTETRARYFRLRGVRMPFPPGVLGSICSVTYNGVMEKLYDLPIRDRRRYAKTVLNQTWQGFTIPVAFVPPTVKAYQEAESNWDEFFGKHVYSPWLEGYDEDQKYSIDTPRMYRELGEMLNYGPDKIQHIMRSGISRDAAAIAEAVDRYLQGEPWQGEEKNEWPLVGRLFARNPKGFGAESSQQIRLAEQKYASMMKRLDNDGSMKARILRAHLSADPADAQIAANPLYDASPQMQQNIYHFKNLHRAWGMMQQVERHINELEKVGLDKGTIDYYREQQVRIAQAALAGTENWREIAEELNNQLELYTQESQQ
jgi:hypothetical protein